MIENVEGLTREVRMAIDMNRTRTSLLADGDEETLLLDELIESKLATAARIVATAAPAHLLDSGKPLGGTITFAERVGIGRGRLQLPDDFLRLVTFKMSDWARAVTEPIAEQDPSYRLQSSRWPGLRGNPERPVCALIHEPEGLVLEFWSCTGGEGVALERGRYLPIPKIRSSGDSDGSKNIEICEKLRGATILMAGSLTLQAMGDDAQAARLRAEAEEMMK